MRILGVGLTATVLVTCLVSSAWAQVSDVTPPQLLAFDFTPTSIDVTTSPQSVTATLRVTDDISGVSHVFVDFRSPSDKQQFFRADRVSGDQFDGVYRGTLEMPQFVESGVWTARILLQDSLNVATLLPATLQGLGFPTDLTVTSTPDTNPPVAVSLSVNPSAADVSSGDVPVTVTLRLTDDVSGIQLQRGADLVISLRSPSGNQTQFLSGSQLTLMSGGPLDGTWQGVKVMPQFSESGTWTGRVESLDRAGNFGQGNLGQALTVTSVPSDTIAPVPTGLQFSPLFVNTSLGPQTIQVSLTATDALAGVDFSAPTPDFNFGTPLFFRSPSGGQGAGAFDLQPSSGTPNSGTWTGTIQLGQFSEQGTWRVDRLRLTDRTRNVRTYDAPTLAAMGFPTEIVVARPSLAPDGSVDASGGLIQDDVFGSAASVVIPPGAVAQTTVVAIDVFESPLNVPTPNGFLGLGTNFVSINLNPAPTLPFPPPGATLVLPLPVPLPPDLAISLYFIDAASGSLEPMLDFFGTPVVGTVDGGGQTATFMGISHFSIVVGLLRIIDDDTTPPSIIGLRSPDPNANGWNNSAVTVSFQCSDESGLASGSPPPPTVLALDGKAQSVTGTCTDQAGNSASFTVSDINIDQTPPVISFAGNAGSYTIAEAITVSCSATDALSGVASNTCAAASLDNVPAYTLGTGSHVRSASATDFAGNNGSGSTTFSVVMPPGSLCGLTTQFIQSSSKYLALKPAQRAIVDKVGMGLCQHLAAIVPRLSAAQKAALVRAYKKGVTALVPAGWLTQGQAAILSNLADSL